MKRFIIIIFLFPLLSYSQILKDTVKLKVIDVKESQTGSYLINSIEKKELELSPVRDIGSYLRTQPNVSGVRKGGIAIDPVIRGFRFNQINTIIDGGIKLEGGCPNRMDPAAAHIEIEDIEKIDIIKGPYILKYGPTLGGIINIETKKPVYYDKFKLHADAIYAYESNWEGQRRHINIYGGNKKLFFLAGGGNKVYGNYKDGNNNNVNSAFKKYNTIAKLGFAPSEKHSFLVSYIEDHGRDVMYPALPMDEAIDNTKIMSFDYKAKALTKHIKSLDIKVYNSDVEHIMDSKHKPYYFTDKQGNKMKSTGETSVDAINSGGRAEINLLCGVKKLLIIGTDYERVFKDGTKKMTMEMLMSGLNAPTITKTNVWRKAFTENSGLFSEFKTTVYNTRISLTARLDYNKAKSQDSLCIENYYKDLTSNFINFSAGLAFDRQITNHINAGFSLARATRSPNITERFIKLLAVGYDNYDYLGNPQLKPETNNQLDLTLRFIEQKNSFYINGFFAVVDNYITGKLIPETVIKSSTRGAPGVKQFYNADYVILRGFELGYKTIFLNRLSANLITGFTQASITETNKYIIENGKLTGLRQTLKNDPLPEMPPLEANLSLAYSLFKDKLRFSFNINYAATQNYVSDAMYEKSSPDYWLADANVNYRLFKFFKISAGVNNIFDRYYYMHLNRKTFGGLERIYEPGRVYFINLILNI
ncbi:MAG: TonB-dependent receptor [Bacteroidales bacterium]|nr:TonB-dependent receptor [Bacteroidales bacterium]